MGMYQSTDSYWFVRNPKLSRHPALKDTEILAKDTLNGTYYCLQAGNVKILCIYHPPSCPTEIDIWLEEFLLSFKSDSLRHFSGQYNVQ